MLQPMKFIKSFPLFTVLLLGGCVSHSPPANFYVLTATAQPHDLSMPEMLIGVGPVNLADYLKRKQLVNRSSEVRLQLDEFNRWAGELDRNITRVMAENLSRLLSVDAVLPYPWSASLELDYQIVLDINRFDFDEHGKVVLDVQWLIFAQSQNKLIDVQRQHFALTVTGTSQEAQVKAQSEALARLSRALARAIQSAPGND